MTLSAVFLSMYMIVMVIENVPVFLDMVRELMVGLQSKAKSNMAEISRKYIIFSHLMNIFKIVGLILCNSKVRLIVKPLFCDHFRKNILEI